MFSVSLICKNCVFLLSKFWVKYSCVPYSWIWSSVTNTRRFVPRDRASTEICVLFMNLSLFVVAFLMILSGEDTAFMMQNTQTYRSCLEIPPKCPLQLELSTQNCKHWNFPLIYLLQINKTGPGMTGPLISWSKSLIGQFLLRVGEQQDYNYRSNCEEIHHV